MKTFSFLEKKCRRINGKGSARTCLFIITTSNYTTFFRSRHFKIKPIYIIPAFLIGKFTSDTIAIHAGKYASENTQSIIDNALSWHSIAGIVLFLLLIFCLLFINWRTLIQTKKLVLNFKILK